MHALFSDGLKEFMIQAGCYVDGNGKRRKAKYSGKSPCSEKVINNNKKNRYRKKLSLMKAETSLSPTKNDAQTLRRRKFFNSSVGERANEEVSEKEENEIQRTVQAHSMTEAAEM